MKGSTRLYAAVTLSAFAALGLFSLASGGVAAADPADRVTICHATGSTTNPYVTVTASGNGIYNGHIAHQHGNDIIPQFTIASGPHAGTYGPQGDQSILANGCVVAPPTTPPPPPPPTGPSGPTTGPTGPPTGPTGPTTPPPVPPTGPGPEDECPNLAGVQKHVPNDWHKRDGECFPPGGPVKSPPGLAYTGINGPDAITLSLAALALLAIGVFLFRKGRAA